MDTSLMIHIASGFTALSSGTVAMVVKKGNFIHKKSGSVFFYAMLGVVFSGLWISYINESIFLFTIALFALYQNVAGRKSISNKSLRPNWLDYLLLLIGFANGALMVYTMNIVLLVFGGIQLMLVLGDARTFWKIKKGIALPPLTWMRRHIGMMIGSYIATITAFLVINVRDVQPYWVVWLAPTAILIPLMIYWTKKFTQVKRSA